MRTFKAVGIALAVGVALLGVAAIVALIVGRQHFYPIVAGIAIVAVVVGGIMSSGADVRRPPGMFRASAANPVPRSTDQLHASESGLPSDPGEVVDEGLESRLQAGWLFLAALPAIVVTVVHYLL